MKTILVLVVTFLFLGCASSLKPSENIRNNFSGEILDDSKKSKVAIYPFRNLSGTKKYPNSALIGRILYDGIYGVVAYFPSFDVPEKATLTNPAGVLETTNAKNDFVIAGDYDLKGDKNDPLATVRLTVWSRMTGETFTNVIHTKTDTDIFDAVDKMIAGIVKVTLKEDAKFALLELSDFKVGREKFDIYINRKFLVRVTNDSFSLGLKVLPDRAYQVNVIRLTDLKDVLNRKIVMAPATVTNVSYEAAGKVRIELVGQKPGESYRIYLDGNEVTGIFFLEHIGAGRTHVLRKMNVKENYSYQTTFSLRDGEVRKIPLYNQVRDLYDLDKDSAYIEFERPASGSSSVQVPIAKVMKGNISGLQNQLNGYISYLTESNTIYLWANSDQPTRDFKIIIADRDRELFVYEYRDIKYGWSGSKRLEVPFSEFKPYVWQHSEELNGEIDYPIDSVYFNNGRSSFSVMGIYFNRNEPYRGQ